MANFYLDISAIGNEYQAYADTPTTWGVPQDGNGKAGPGHSAAVAIGTIDCASASASGAGQLLVLGVSVSSTLTGSGAALATNIVAAINATATATGATYSALLLPLNKLVFARVNPGVSTGVQIMLRIAGTDWNGMTHTTAGTWGTVPTMGAFASGANGPFGYFFNTATAFGKAALAYGPVTAYPASVVDPGADSDVIHIRVSRAGANLVFVNSALTQSSISSPAGASRFYLFDNGTVWGGDTGTFQWNWSLNSSNSSVFRGATGKYFRVCARSKYGLLLTFTNANSGVLIIADGAGAGTSELQNIAVVEGNSTSPVYVCNCGSSGWSFIATGCSFTFLGVHTINSSFNSNTYGMSWRAYGCDFNWVSIGVSVSNIVNVHGASFSGSSAIHFVNCNFSVDGGAYFVTSPLSGANNVGTNSMLEVAFVNCSGLANPSAGFVATTYNSNARFLWDAADSGRSFRYETHNYQFDWIADGTYPTYSAIDASGSPISQRLSWDATRLNATKQIAVGRYGCWYANASSIKTLAIEILVLSSDIPDQAQVGMSVKYIAADGSRKFENALYPYGSHLAGIAPALVDGVGVGSWSLNGVTGVVSKKIQLTTLFAVKTGSEIVAELIVQGPPAITQSIYINPELVLV